MKYRGRVLNFKFETALTLNSQISLPIGLINGACEWLYLKKCWL